MELWYPDVLRMLVTAGAPVQQAFHGQTAVQHLLYRDHQSATWDICHCLSEGMAPVSECPLHKPQVYLRAKALHLLEDACYGIQCCCCCHIRAQLIAPNALA